jgi:serine/threonine-protein kinase HipA
MPEQPIRVSVQVAGQDIPAGRIWTHRHGGSQSATFAYLPEYLAQAEAYALDPGLPLLEGQQQTAVGQALFGAFSDCAPDGWGRRLVVRAEQHRAREESRTTPGLAEIDYLLGARDDLRQGALRLRVDNPPYRVPARRRPCAFDAGQRPHGDARIERKHLLRDPALFA